MYVAGTREYYDNETTYVMYETNTESFFIADKLLLTKIMVDYKINVINANITEGNGIEIKLWYNKINCEQANKIIGSVYILICKTDDDKFKLISYQAKVVYWNRERLNEFIIVHKIANWDITDGSLKYIDTYTLNKDNNFEENINKKYERHVAITNLLGHNMTFEYIIEGKKVKLEKYTGTSKDVIVPKFITSIMQNAFYDCAIEKILLEDGLQHIGRLAFRGCNLSEITIPKTVKSIGKDAFAGNTKLLTPNSCFRQGRVNILNKNIAIIE